MGRLLWLLGMVMFLVMGQGCEAGDGLGSSGGSSASGPADYDLADRPTVDGITRSTLRDDPELTVTRVAFAPGASEVPHTHAFDLLVVPLTAGPVSLVVGDEEILHLAPGEVQLIPAGIPHMLGNTGDRAFEIIAIAVHR